ncbi:MAG: hypothetical protein L6R42_007124 [Xanthoria sp. 1 TBL-2021]|nr:MAG: hypothetical protein L6R42_007124 [Xanthoria sp. 1 TBL-2021]
MAESKTDTPLPPPTYAQSIASPINLILFALLLTLVYLRLRPKPPPALSKAPPPIVFRTFTPPMLKPYNGENNMPVYLAVNGKVFDVSNGRNFYGPGGPYENFAGRDASRGLACGSFDEDMLTKDLEGPLDDLKGLGDEEWEAMRGWEERFQEKYLVAGSMVDEKPNKYEHQDSLPIPTYEEAISSRPSSSQSYLGPEEVSHDAERQGLLTRDRPHQNNGYDPPTVESARSSLDFLPSSGGSSRRSSAEALQREIQQMDIEEPGDPNTRLRASRFSKRITSLTHSLSSINLPFRQWLPSGQYLRAKIPSWPQVLRFQPNWIIVGRIFAIFLVVFIIWLFFISDLFIVRNTRMNNMFDPENLRTYVLNHVDADNIRHNLQYATKYDHMAGTEGSYSHAIWVETAFQQAGLEHVGLEKFEVYLNNPKLGGRRVAIVDPPELQWMAKLEEELVYPVEWAAQQTPVFHGHSKSGNVTGPLVYANYGSRADFEQLANSGINLEGSIALVRYYGTQGDRALKVKAAELAGAANPIQRADTCLMMPFNADP